MVVDNIIDVIGKTPIVDLKKLTNYNIFAKAEFLNPGGSIKDRIAKYMIEQAEKEGKLKTGMTIIEPTSGNTGIGLALVGVQKGYNVIIVMPENMSEERKKIIKALGAKLILTPKEENVEGAVKAVKEMCNRDKSLYVFNQFENLDNKRAHYYKTAPEIWEQLNHKIDVFVSGLGSGGTLAGIGAYLKEHNKDCKIIAVEPKNVSALLGHEPGFHKIQGIGDGFIPAVLDTKLIDDVIEVTDESAINMSRKLASNCGLLVGTSSGANVWAACEVAKKTSKDIIIATVLPDRVERYFSTSLI